MKMNKRTKRVIALVCTLVMIISMIPAEFTKNVMATTLEKCTISLKYNTNIKEATVSLINNATNGKVSVTILGVPVKPKYCAFSKNFLTSLCMEPNWLL